MESLSILLPGLALKNKTSGAGSKPCTAQEKEIERLTLHSVSLINDRNWSSPDWQMLAADCETLTVNAETRQSQSSLSATTRSAFLHKLKVLTDTYPKYAWEALSCTVNLLEGGKEANAWLCLRTSGMPKGWKNEKVVVLQWRLEDGDWRVWKQTVLQGAGIALDS